MADNSKSLLVGAKKYQLTIEGDVPIEIGDMPPEQIAAAMISLFQVSLGVSQTITSLNCKLLQQKL